MDVDDFIPLSALQHYLYCPRQCALIHLEQQWAESRETAEGRLLHDRADTPAVERRHGVHTVTAMPLSSAELGIAGMADVVEFLAGTRGVDAAKEELERLIAADPDEPMLLRETAAGVLARLRVEAASSPIDRTRSDGHRSGK